MISLPRLTFILGIAVVETAPLALLLLLVGVGGIWMLLLGIVLLGALLDWAAQLWLPAERQRLALFGIALLLALWVIKARVVGDYGPLGGWGAALDALFSLRSGPGGPSYLLLLVTLYCFWRGSRLLGHDQTRLRAYFTRATIALMVIVGFGFWIANAAPEVIAPATGMVLVFFAAGLLAIALADVSDGEEAAARRLDWRGLLTLAGAIGLVLVVGVLFVSLFGMGVAQALFTIWTVVVTIIVLILLPLVLLMEAAIQWVISTIGVLPTSPLANLQEQQLQQQQQAAEPLRALPPWLAALIQLVLAMIPLLVMAGLFLLMRRRARRAAPRDEERESLWSWRGMAADLRGLLAGLRRAEEGGLRAALARMRGADPVSRIRRSYIRLLLLGEARERPRAAPQTPREYAPDAGALLPSAAQPIATLTDAYERARYHPSSAGSADADDAERAWGAIDGADRRA